ncbi:MAG: hypothetical protein KJT03_20890, partial [Verrucomicrobiae bacterium]|nr:hypothetical protein [Verrucomicrobiae bacterium]
MDSKIISPDANSAFRSKYRNTVFLVIPEKVGVEFDISAKQLADVVKLNLSSGVPDAKFSEFREIEIDGLTWIRFNALAQIAGHSLAYSYAVLSHNGFQYQLIYWKESYLLNSAELELEDLLSKFHLIDADKIQSSDKFHSVSGFKDSTTGFSIDLGDLEWMNWPNHEVDIPQAKFSASYKNKVFLFATPVFHQELKPTIKSLKAAVLEQVFGLEPTVIANTKDRLIRRGDDRTLRSLFTFPGVALDIVNHAILEFWSGKNISYCIGGFSTDSSLLPRLEEALDRSSFLPPEALELAYEELRPEEIFFQSQVLNSIAISLYAQNNFSGAKQYLDLSLNFSKEDPIILSNYGSICVSLEKFDDLLKLYESSPDAFDEFYAFREWHALALSRVNRKGEAEEEFNEMLETGNLSETGLWSFLELLSADSRWEDGIEICGSY